MRPSISACAKAPHSGKYQVPCGRDSHRCLCRRSYRPPRKSRRARRPESKKFAPMCPMERVARRIACHLETDRGLAIFRLRPGVGIDNAKLRHLDRFPPLRRIDASEPFTGRGLLDVGAAIPDEAAVIKASEKPTSSCNTIALRSEPSRPPRRPLVAKFFDARLVWRLRRSWPQSVQGSKSSIAWASEKHEPLDPLAPGQVNVEAGAVLILTKISRYVE